MKLIREFWEADEAFSLAEFIGAAVVLALLCVAGYAWLVVAAVAR